MFLPDLIAKNWTRKLTSLFFAVLIWYVVDQQLQEFTHLKNIPVEILTESGYLVVNKGTQFVTVKVRGPEDKLKSISSPDIKISIYIPSTDKIGFIELPVGHEDISLPHGVTVEDVIPPRVTIDIDRIETKKGIPIRIVTSGKLSSALKETEENRSVNPQTVDITGPSRLLTGIESIQTEPEFFDSKIIGSYEKTIKVAKLLPLVTASPDKVTVSFDINEISGEQVFRDIPILLLKNEKSSALKLAKMIPALDQVTLQGPKEALKNITLENIKAFIDISGITEPGRHRMPIKVWLANSELKMIFASPSSIDIELEKKQDEIVTDPVPEPAALDPKLKDIEDEGKLLIKKDEAPEVDPKLKDIEAENILLIESK